MDKTDTGILLRINPQTGSIKDAYVLAGSDQEQAVIEKSFSRITRPSCKEWLKRLVRPKH